jgi:hypothetical protein
VRPDIGLGAMATFQSNASPTEGDVTLSGGAGMFGVIVGYAVSENLILGLHVFDTFESNPNVSFSSGLSGGTSNTSISLFGIGPSMTYYWPSNYYLTATVHLSRLSITVDGADTNANTGFGARMVVGREWWISDHWGLGLNGQVGYANNGDPNPNGSSLHSFVAGLMFSATYN